MPKVRWFTNQRDALGLEAAVYAFMAVGEIRTVTLSLFLSPNLSFTLTLTLSRTLPLGACDEVVQWGFDETTLDGTSCFNQWCLLRTGEMHGLVVAFLVRLVVFVSPCKLFGFVSFRCKSRTW